MKGKVNKWIGVGAFLFAVAIIMTILSGDAEETKEVKNKLDESFSTPSEPVPPPPNKEKSEPVLPTTVPPMSKEVKNKLDEILPPTSEPVPSPSNVEQFEPVLPTTVPPMNEEEVCVLRPSEIRTRFEALSKRVRELEKALNDWLEDVEKLEKNSRQSENCEMYKDQYNEKKIIGENIVKLSDKMADDIKIIAICSDKKHKELLKQFMEAHVGNDINAYRWQLKMRYTSEDSNLEYRNLLTKIEVDAKAKVTKINDEVIHCGYY